MMSDEIRHLRVEAQRLAHGKHPSQVRYPEPFRRAAIATARSRLAQGGSVAPVALDLGIDGRATSGRPAGEPGPVLAKAAALPAQHGRRSDDDQRLPPPGPDSGQAGPERAVSRVELRAWHRSLVDGELLAQGEVLEGQLAVAADGGREGGGTGGAAR
jgi:hypothetical protein